jgi:hypothetical protein
LGLKARNTTITGGNRNYSRFQGRFRNRGQQLARNRIRLATQILGMKKWNKQQTLPYWNSGSAQGGYKVS